MKTCSKTKCICVTNEGICVLVDGFGECGEDVSSSSPSVDSTTPGDLDTLNIPNTDVKTKFDVISTGDGSYGMLDPANSANSSTSKASEKAMDSEEEQSVNTKLNETAKTTPKSEGQHTPELGLPADGLITTVKTDQDAVKVDQNSSHTPVGSPPGLPVPSSTSQQQQHNIHTQQKQALSLGNDTTSTSPQSTKCSTSEQHVSGSGNVLSPGSSSGSKPENQDHENKDVVMSSPSGISPPASGDKDHLSGVIRQGPQNVTVTTPARMNLHCFGGNGVYSQGQPHPRGMNQSVMGMPHGGAMAMASNNSMGTMNNVSPPQASVPPQMRHSGYTSPPNQQSNYAHPNAQFNPQMAHQTLPMPSMNGQGFANMRGNMTHNNGQWCGQMTMGNDSRPFPQRRAMRNPPGMPQYPQDCYSPQGFPSHGQPNPQQNPRGFGNQFDQIQKNMPYAGGAYSGQNFNDHQTQYGMVSPPGPNSHPNGGNYPQQNFGVGGGPHGPGTMGPVSSAPGPSVGVPLVHNQQGSSATASGGTGRVDGSFTGYHGNPLTHFPAGREPPPPTAAGPGGTGQVSGTAAMPVNSSNNSMAGPNHHTQQRSANFNNNYGPHLNSSPHSHQQQQHQLHDNRTVGPHQMYASMDHSNMNPQCPPNNTSPFNSQYNGPYTNPQQTGNHDTGNNNHVTSGGNDVTNPLASSGDIPEFSMFGDYAPQNEYVML